MQTPLRLAPLWYGFSAALLGVVAILSLNPIAAPPAGVGDKYSHLLTYLVLGGWFSLLAVNRSWLLWTVAGVIAFGMAMEGLQAMTAYRHAEWGDVLANSAGVLLGVLVYFSPLPRWLRASDGKLAVRLQR